MERKHVHALVLATAILTLLALPALAVPTDTVGISNKALLNPIMAIAAPDYIWTLWGKVTVIDSDSFTIDDGSGVNIEVAAPGYADLGVGDGNYVVVRGTFDATKKILTSHSISKGVNYSSGFTVTGGRIRALKTDGMTENRPAPNGYITCGVDSAAGHDRYSMLFDIGSKPAGKVEAILIQNTTEFTTWRVVGKVNIKVSSHEDEYGFDPENISLYDTTVLSNSTVMPTASVTPWNQEGLQAGAWRTAALTVPVAKRFYLIEVTHCPDGPVTEAGKNYFFIGDVSYALSSSVPPLDGYDVTGGIINAVTTDAMVEYRPAPNGYIGCYASTIATDDKVYSMCLDIGSKSARKVVTILLQNTTEYTTWRVAGKVNVKVSSHENEPGFNPANASLYDTTVLSNGIIKPTASVNPLNQEGLQAGVWRSVTLTTPVAKRFFLIQVTECPDGMVTEAGKSYFFLGDVNYAHGFAVTGGIISALKTDGMTENRPAPNGYITCGVDSASGHDRYSMLLDVGCKPTTAVAAIMLQNTTEFTTWRVIGKVNVRVSSHENEPWFDPANTSLYDTTVLSNGTVMPTASVDPWNMAGLEAGAWRYAALTTPAVKRYFLIEVTHCPDGPVTEAGKNYFFIGDVNYAYGLHAADLGKQWIRNHPFVMNGWSVRWGDYLLNANKLNTFMGCGINSAILPLSTVEEAGPLGRTTANDLSLISAANAAGMNWHGQLSCADIGKVSRCVDSITTPQDSNGWFIRDEPSAELLPAVGRVANWLRARRPNSPIYVSGIPAALTNDNAVVLQSAVNQCVKPDILYASSIELRCAYPFDNTGHPYMDRAGFYDGLMGIRHYASLYNKPFLAWMQCFLEPPGQTYMPSQSQMRMNVFGYLTGGCKGLSYFLLDSSDDGAHGGMVAASGVPTPHYYYVQDMKDEVHNLGSCLRYLESTSLFFLPGPGRGGVLSDGETAWTSMQGGNVTCTTDSADKKGGSSSAKVVVASGATTGLIAVKSTASTNMSYHKEVYLWIKSSVSVAANQLQFLLDNSPDCTSPTETFNVPALAAGTWTRLCYTLASPASDGAIISVGIKQVADIGACTLWLDEVGTIPVGLSKWSASADPDSHITNITINSPAALYRDGLIGFFSDDAGQKYFMLTNMHQGSSLSKTDATTNFTITFTPGTLLYRLRRSDGVVEQVLLTNNQYTFNLEGGTGDLFKYDNGTFAGL